MEKTELVYVTKELNSILKSEAKITIDAKASSNEMTKTILKAVMPLRPWKVSVSKTTTRILRKLITSDLMFHYNTFFKEYISIHSSHRGISGKTSCYFRYLRELKLIRAPYKLETYRRNYVETINFSDYYIDVTNIDPCYEPSSFRLSPYPGVYLIEGKNGKGYIGSSRDINHRIKQHQSNVQDYRAGCLDKLTDNPPVKGVDLQVYVLKHYPPSQLQVLEQYYMCLIPKELLVNSKSVAKSPYYRW